MTSCERIYSACHTGDIEALEVALLENNSWNAWLRGKDQEECLLGVFLLNTINIAQHQMKPSWALYAKRLNCALLLIEQGANCWPKATQHDWGNTPMLHVWRMPDSAGMGNIAQAPKSEDVLVAQVLAHLMQHAPTPSCVASTNLLDKVMYVQNGPMVRLLANHGLFDACLNHLEAAGRQAILQRKPIPLPLDVSKELGKTHPTLHGNLPNSNVLASRMHALGLVDKAMLTEAGVTILGVSYDDGQWTKALIELECPWGHEYADRIYVGAFTPWSLEQLEVWLEHWPQILSQPVSYQKNVYDYLKRQHMAEMLEVNFEELITQHLNTYIVSFEEWGQAEVAQTLTAIVKLAKARLERELLLGETAAPHTTHKKVM